MLVSFLIVLTATVIAVAAGSKTRMTPIFKSFFGAFLSFPKSDLNKDVKERKGVSILGTILNIVYYLVLPCASGVLFYFAFKGKLTELTFEFPLGFDSTLLALFTIFFGISGLNVDQNSKSAKQFAASIDQTMGVLFVSIILIVAKMVLIPFSFIIETEGAFSPNEIAAAFYYGISGLVIALFFFVAHSIYNHKHRENTKPDDKKE